MAKRRPRISHAAGYKRHAVSIRAAINRDISPTGRPRFLACVGVGKKFNACAAGRNPRVALAAALRVFAKGVAGRGGGAFAGLGWRR